MNFSPDFPSKSVKMIRLRTAACFLAGLACTSFSHGAVKLDLNDEASLQLGARLQTLYMVTDSDIVNDRDQADFKVRRARLRVRADMNSWFGGFIQTEYSEDASAGSSDMRIIDAFLQLRPSKALEIYMGQHMAPALRQNLTSSGALMAIDRPGIIYKPVSWGTRALGSFSNRTINTTDAGLDGSVNVRDMGITFFGNTSFSDTAHVKYYAGTYDGATSAAGERYTLRAQLNLGEPETGYYNKSTYLGKKNTLAFGASYDQQSNVAKELSSGNDVNYGLYSADVFAEKKWGKGTLSVESAYINLNLDDADILAKQDGTTALSSVAAVQSQGSGYYAQLGYTINKWQPWVLYENWSSDADNGAGSFSSTRIGATYFIEGHKANVKFGYESLRSDTPFSSSAGSDDTMNTFVVGLYLDF